MKYEDVKQMTKAEFELYLGNYEAGIRKAAFEFGIELTRESFERIRLLINDIGKAKGLLRSAVTIIAELDSDDTYKDSVEIFTQFSDSDLPQ